MAKAKKIAAKKPPVVKKPTICVECQFHEGDNEHPSHHCVAPTLKKIEHVDFITGVVTVTIEVPGDENFYAVDDVPCYVVNRDGKCPHYKALPLTLKETISGILAIVLGLGAGICLGWIVVIAVGRADDTLREWHHDILREQHREEEVPR